MAQPIEYEWTPANTTEVANVQSLAGAGSLVLNGSLVPHSTPNQGFVQFPNFSRTVSLTSVNNLSAVNFTINGFSEIGPIQETIAGPNNNTVESTVIFNKITSITTNAAAAAVSAGTGHIGRTYLFSFNYNSPYPALSVSVSVVGVITYTFQCTIENADLGNAFFFNPIAGMTNATTDQAGSISFPIKYAWIEISASTANAALVATFIQQGIV